MGKWAIITGGGQGIGAALVLSLSGSGCNVLVVDINLDPLEQLLTQHPARGLVHTMKGKHKSLFIFKFSQRFIAEVFCFVLITSFKVVITLVSLLHYQTFQNL